MDDNYVDPTVDENGKPYHELTLDELREAACWKKDIFAMPELIKRLEARIKELERTQKRHWYPCIGNRGNDDWPVLPYVIGFNEPLSALRSRTRIKALTPTTIEQNRHLFDPPSRMPKRAVTMGVGTILEAKRILLLATGEAKADILAKAVEGPVTSMVTASSLQLHQDCTIVVDEAAGSKLQEKDYYNWIFQNEPEWEEFR